ncbi:MAG: S1C family serine protease [bacterium]
MNTKSTIAWRFIVVGLLAVTAPVSIYWYEKRSEVDAETMLDVSVSIKTISFVQVDSVGDSVWSAAGGSGILISNRDCEVLTNHHVVENAAHIEIFPRQWPNTSGIAATVINSNPRSDVALLRMSHCEGLPQARLGNSDFVSSGDEVYAVGNPLGENPDSISRGILSHTERFQKDGLPYLQTDANINQGNSGGALFSRRAEVIGVNTGLLATPSGQKFGIGYALPINLVKDEVSKLRNGTPNWGDAGIDDLVAALTPDEASIFKVPNGQGAIILTDTAKAGPGSGKLFAKDVIYKINNNKVTNVDQVKLLINRYEAGESVRFGLIRKGKFIDIDIELINGWKTQETPGADYYEGYLGLSLEMWDEESLGGHFDSPVITNVKSLSPSHLAYISSSQKTVLNRGPLTFPIQLSVKAVTGIVIEGDYFPIRDIAELERRAFEAYQGKQPLLLEIEAWGRSNPMNLKESLQLQKVSFHRVIPKSTSVPVPELPPINDRFDTVAVNHLM